MHVIVVGAGLAGLTAAYLLDRNGHQVTVLESAPVAGGKLRRLDVGGVIVDVGAEAMLNRRPEGVALARELGLEVVHPAVASSRLWSRGALRPLPRSLMGVPLDLRKLRASGVLSDQGMARAEAEQPGLPVGRDLSVGELVGSRLGEEVVDRLVEPLLGGVYAGHARLLSARATTPQLVAFAEQGPLLAAELPAAAPGPVFAGLPGGMARLVEELAARVRPRTGATVRELTRTGRGFAVTFGPTIQAERLEADAVVLATPAAPTARLLGGLVPAAASELAAIEYASMAVITLAFPAAEVSARALGDSSGFLVPPVEGRAIKAATFSFAKWRWVRDAGAAEGLVHLRTSLGRHGEEAALQRTDEELIAASLADLTEATGVRAAPVAHHVQRWGGGLPQYVVGHLDRVARIREAVDQVPGLAVCGAAYDGVGIPAVIASARRAVSALTGGPRSHDRS